METKSEGEDETSEPTIDNIMKDIFIRCDTDNRDLVQVSKLIEYIKPFMLNNMSDLMNLCETLDPQNVNPEISSSKFHKAMLEWTSTISSKDSESNVDEKSFHNTTPRDFGKFLIVESSTPRSNFGNRLFKGQVESILDISCSSPQNSLIDHTPGLNVDKTYLEEQINELNHQNRKSNEELFRVKHQLASAEELCENLQMEVEKLTRQFNHEREINEQMQNNQNQFEVIKESSSNAKKQVEKLIKRLSTADKENAVLQAKISDFDSEKQVFEDRITKLHKKLEESKLAAVELAAKMKLKDDEIVQLEQLNANLIKELDNHKKMLEDANDANKCLMVEKESVEKMLHRRMKRTSMTRSQSICEYSLKHLRLKSGGKQPRRRNSLGPHANHKTVHCAKLFAEELQKSILEQSALDNRNAETTPTNDSVLLLTPIKSKTRLFSCEGDGTLSPVQKLDHSSASASTSFNVNDSSDSEECWKISGLNLSNTHSPHDSLQAEFAQIASEKLSGNSDLNLQLLEMENRVLQLESELQEYRNSESGSLLQNLEKDKLKLKFEEIEQKFSNLYAENERLRKEIAEKDNSLRDFESLTKICQVLNEESESLHKSNQANSEKIANLLDELDIARQAHQDDISKLVKSRENVRIELSMERAQNLKLEEELQELNKLKTEISEKILAISAINKKCQELQTEFENTTSRSKDEILTLQEEVKRLKTQRDKLKTETDKSSSENASLKSKLNLAQDSLIKIEAIHDAKLKDLEKLQNENFHLQESLTRSNIENERIKTEIEEVKTELISSRQQISLNESALAKGNEEEARLKSEIEKIAEERETLKQRVSDLEMQVKEQEQVKDELEDIKRERCEDVKIIQEINSAIQRSKEDVNCLEEKFLKSCDQIDFLQTENSNLSQNLIRLSIENDLTLDRLSSATEIQQLVTVLSKDSICSVCKSSKEKLEKELSNFKVPLAGKVEIVKEIEDFNSDLKSAVDEKSRKKIPGLDAGKRNNYDRLKLKLEKSEEKIEKLQETLKAEMESKKAAEKIVAGIQEELKHANSGLFENRQRIRRATFNFVKKWRVLFDNIAAMEDIVDEIDNGEAPCLRHTDRCTDRALEKELFLLKTDIQLNANILERLGDTDLLDIIHLLEHSRGVSVTRPISRFCLKPPTLIVRSMSPDSPSADTDVSSLTITNEQPAAESPTSNTRADSAGHGDASSVSVGSFSIEEVGSSEDTDQKETCYEDRGDEAMYVLDGFGQIFEDIECGHYSDTELETKFTTFVMEVTIDNSSVKRRCEEHSIRLNRAEVELTTSFQNALGFLRRHLRGDVLKQMEAKMEHLLRGSSHLSRLAEQFGGLKQQHRLVQMTNLMINYVSSIRRNLEQTSQSLRRCTKLNRELVSTADYPPKPERHGSNYPLSWMTVDEILELVVVRERLDELPPV